MAIRIYFSDFFEVSKRTIETFGAFNISLMADLPLFIDPFLLFNSKKPEYQKLHREMIRYLAFLREKSVEGNVHPALVGRWYRFPEVKQNHFGFCLTGNAGRGLGADFANALNTNLHDLFSDFGSSGQKISKGQHLEKLCLIRERVGRDNISDFTTNLIKGFLLEYTARFAEKHINAKFRKDFAIDRVRFNFDTESWETQTFNLPSFENDFVLLTPKDILTKDDIWINKHDLLEDFSGIRSAIPNDQLRAQVDNYFRSVLPKRATERETKDAVRKTIVKFRELIDYYIRYKEEHGDEAMERSLKKVFESHDLYVEQFQSLAEKLARFTEFYSIGGNTKEETRKRILFLKDVIENKDGYRVFYLKSEEPIERESDLQILFRLTWYGAPSDVNREVNNGRGPTDFTVSRGSADKCLVEMKLAKNTALKRNLQNQTEIGQKASGAQTAFKVIVYFSFTELRKVQLILKQLKMENDDSIILIDARRDNKPSASKA